jgi:CBS domain-containing protein
MTVREVAREDVVTTTPDATVAAAVEEMRESNVGSLVVVEGAEPVGILTDRDVVMQVVGTDHDPAETTVEAVMSDELTTVDVDAGVMELFDTIAAEGVRRVPVVDDGALVGIVTLDDLVVLLSMEFQAVANVIRTESPPYETEGNPFM